MSETLLDRAYRNIKAAKANYNLKNDDEFFLNLTGYLLQQALEFAIKHVLEVNGVSYPYTHKIDILLDLLPGDKYDVPSNIRMSHGTITSWESQTRYIKDYFLAKKEIDLLMPVVLDFITYLSPAGVSNKEFDLVLNSIPEELAIELGDTDEERVINYMKRETPVAKLLKELKDSKQLL